MITKSIDKKGGFRFHTIRLKKVQRFNNNAGLTLIEVLVSLMILGIIMVGLHQVLGTALSAYDQTTSEQELLAQARYAMARMVMFVQKTDEISQPPVGQQKQWLVVSERLLDMYNNADHTYIASGDGYLDADNDADSLVNEDATDPKEYIRFDLDKSDGDNWKLMEEMPDYSTGTIDDKAPENVLCEHVTDFQASTPAEGLVEIQLTLNDGKNEVSLKTRVKSMYVP